MSNVRRNPRAQAPAEMNVEVTRHVGGPLFAQLREQIQALVERGALTPGDRLPPVRTLAAQLNVNQITVARAYSELSDLGVVEGRRGGGTFVCERAVVVAKKAPDRHVEGAFRPLLADRLFELSRAPGVIAFTSNYPFVGTDMIEEFRACVRLAAGRDFENCFHYEPPLGRLAARQEISRYLDRRGMDVDPEKIVVTSGAQQAIDLAVRSVVEPGTPVIVERPAYYGALNALRGAGAEILEAPLDGDGIDLQGVESHLVKHQARLIYVNPTFQNPTGQTMSETKRRDLLALARRFDAVILEDDHSSDWRFAGRPVPAIAALAGPEHRVFYAYSFGKTLLPGQRFGFLVVPPSLRRIVLNQKAALDLHGPSFLQEALAHFLLRGNHEVFFEGARTSYGERQKNLRQRLLAQMPVGTKVSAPDGGLSFWITLPEGAEASELYFRAVRRGVAFVPGEAFFATKPDIEALRVSFGLVPETEISEGIDRLCAVVGDLLTPRRERSVILT